MIICADDYGQCAEDNAAILDLARAGRLSAVSVMMTPGVDLQSDRLAALSAGLDIGLHLVLTDVGAPLSDKPPRGLLGASGKFYAWNVLARRACLGRLPPGDVFCEIQAQLDAFREAFGRWPDFIDGHLHVQQLPGVRAPLAELAAAVCRERPCYVRNAWEAPGVVWRRGISPLKHWAIAAPARVLRRELRARGVPTNHGFAGVYAYGNWRRFPRYFEIFNATARDVNTICMTHPGRSEAWRAMEYAVLRGAAGPRPNRFRHGGPV